MDRLVNVLSQWLAGHVTADELRRELENVGTAGLGAGQAEAVHELLGELRNPNGHAGELNMLAREAIEALCLGV
ncbi:MAG: hypothetical protein ABR583_02360 [Gaiellaceae bacterium]